MLTIYSNHLGGNLVCKQKYLTIKFDVMGESDPSQNMSKSFEQMAKSVETCITANHSPYFLKLFSTKWHESFDFLTRISGFPMSMLRTPRHQYMYIVNGEEVFSVHFLRSHVC